MVVDGPTKCEKIGHYRIGVLVKSSFPQRNIQFRRNRNTSAKGIGVRRFGAEDVVNNSGVQTGTGAGRLTRRQNGNGRYVGRS